MTVEYVQVLSTVTATGAFKLLARWKGSIYKLMWKDFVVFVALYYTIYIFYQFLNPVQRNQFLVVAEYCQKYSGIIPVNLVLGFYVTQVLGRFYDQYNSIPWMSRVSIFVSAHVQGQDDVARLLRRTIVRYICLSFVLTMWSVSPQVKKRFPTLQHMTDAGLFTENEQKVFEGIITIYNKWFVPLVWATSVIARARKQGKIQDDFYHTALVNEVTEIREKLHKLFCYDWVQIPLVYSQVVTLVVYSYFIACLIGKQDIANRNVAMELPVPIITFLLFFFYMGWLKVAEQLLNPFGEDDDDFDINFMIDYNIEVAYLIVDELHDKHPPLSRDLFWDQIETIIPYTAAAKKYRKLPFLGTAAELIVPDHLQAYIMLLPEKIENIGKTRISGIISEDGRNTI